MSPIIISQEELEAHRAVRAVAIVELKDMIFQFIPKAKLSGKYAIFHIDPLFYKCDEIEVLINENDDPWMNRNIGIFENSLREKGWLNLCKINDYYNSKIINHELWIIINEYKYRVIIDCNSYNQAFFHATNIQIDKNGNISPRYCDKDISPDEYIYFSKQDIKHKRLSLAKSIKNISESTEKKFSFQKMIDLGGDLLNFGWKIDPFIQRQLLRIKPARNILSNDICVICQESIDEFRSVILNCNHFYHVKCLRTQLLGIGNTTSQCSICRKEIIE